MLDYTKQKKKYLTVKLPDETTVFISSPRKGLYTKIGMLQEALKNTDDYEELYDEILETSATILSNNKAKKLFTPEDVDAMFDVEDMALLILSYGQFAQELTKSPN